MRTIITLIAVLFASVGLAGERIPQSATIRVPLKAYQSSDHIAAATGKTMAVVISKNGGAFGNPSAGATNATEISNGWYYVDLSTTDTGTLGPLVVRGTATGTDDVEIAYDVVNANNHGLAALPNAAAAASGGVPTVDSNNAVKVQAGTGTGQLDFSSGVLKANVTQYGGSNGTFSGGRAEVNVSHFGGSAGSFSSGRPSVNVNTNNDKTGYSLASDGTSGVLIGEGAALNDVLFDNLNAPISSRMATFSLPTNFSALLINGSGHLSRVTLCDTLTTYTGNTPQTGDTFSRVGAPAGASLSADVAAAKAQTAAIEADTQDVQSRLPAALVSGKMDSRLDMNQGVPTSNTAQTVGDALNAARAQGFGKWVKSGTTLTLYAADGTTVVRTLTLDDADNPTSRE